MWSRTDAVSVYTHVGNVSPIRQFPGDLWLHWVGPTPTSGSPGWPQPWWETPNPPVHAHTHSCKPVCKQGYSHTHTHQHKHLHSQTQETKSETCLILELGENRIHMRENKHENPAWSETYTQISMAPWLTLTFPLRSSSQVQLERDRRRRKAKKRRIPFFWLQQHWWLTRVWLRALTLTHTTSNTTCVLVDGMNDNDWGLLTAWKKTEMRDKLIGRKRWVGGGGIKKGSRERRGKMSALAGDENCIAARLQRGSFKRLWHTHIAAASPRQHPAWFVCACVDTLQCLQLKRSLQKQKRETQREEERERWRERGKKG